MSFLKEFKEFAVKGNVIDLAVGIIVGNAFSKIVSSIVADIIMPPVGVFINNIDFHQLKLVLTRKPDGTPIATLNYGNFIQNIVEFIIIALVVFLLVKLISKFRQQKKESGPAPLSREEQILVEIRDILKTK